MQKSFEELKDAYKKAQHQAGELYNQIYNHKDGFIYLVCTSVYRNINYMIYNNGFTLQNLCDEYNGDNGIVDIWTNNPNHGIENRSGSIEVMTLDEIKNFSKKDFRAERIVNNWINDNK